MTDNSLQADEKITLIDTVITAISDDNERSLREILQPMDAVDIARLLESIPDKLRVNLWGMIPEETSGEVLVYLGEVARLSLVDNLDQAEVVNAATSLESQDLADVIETLPEEINDAIRESLDSYGLKKLDATLAFPEDTAGRLMNTEAVSVRAEVNLETVLRYLRRRKAVPDHTVGLMVVDREGLFLGELPLSALLTRQPETLVSEAMNRNALRVSPEMPQQELAALFRNQELVSVAVVDEQNKLIGRVTIDNIIEVVHEEADRLIMGTVGLEDEEDLFAPVLPSARRRASWLGINLGTAFLAAWVIGLFEATLDKIVALAVLMPIVASMGGIAGSQTLTLIIRGMAYGKVSPTNTRWLTYKEAAVSGLNGIAWAFVVGAISYLWFSDLLISAVLGAAMIMSLFAAALAGVIIPIGMHRLGIDPALAGSVVLTTVTDVVGFLSFLGLATLFLL
jgi:magnesium transporter